uniref:Ice-structuring protein 4-like n=1 Tax=Macrostomum lignano TaxID=282301 RepID=A0A1I8JQI3_9PLAT
PATVLFFINSEHSSLLGLSAVEPCCFAEYSEGKLLSTVSRAAPTEADSLIVLTPANSEMALQGSSVARRADRSVKSWRVSALALARMQQSVPESCGQMASAYGYQQQAVMSPAKPHGFVGGAAAGWGRRQFVRYRHAPASWQTTPPPWQPLSSFSKQQQQQQAAAAIILWPPTCPQYYAAASMQSGGGTGGLQSLAGGGASTVSVAGQGSASSAAAAAAAAAAAVQNGFLLTGAQERAHGCRYPRLIVFRAGPLSSPDSFSGCRYRQLIASA